MFDREALTQMIAKHGTVVRVVVAAVEGSGPREVGAAMLVWRDGQSGTIGGGALEYEAAAEARRLLDTHDAPGLIRRHALGPALGQCCGGAVTLVSERFDAATLPKPESELGFLRRIDGAVEMPLPLVRHLKRLRAGETGSDLFLSHGWLWEPMARAKRPLWIWGAGHVGRAMVETLAPLPDFTITWIDTAPERFPDMIPQGVTQLPAADPALLVPHAPNHTEHLILTYSHALDLELCHQLLRHHFTFAGLIGSKSKWARFRNRLAALGHSPAQIDRITCPIGRPDLGKHPQAIAIGVAAALLEPQRALSAEKGKSA